VSKPWPSPEQILRSLDQLGVSARQYAERHAQHQASARERFRLTQRRIEAAAKTAAEQLAAALDQARGQFETAVERAKARARQRIARIRQAQVSVRKSAAQRADAEEGRRKFELQREMLRATRERDAGLLAAKNTFESLAATLDVCENQFTSLDAHTRRLLGVFGKRPTQWLDHAHENLSVDLAPDENTLSTQLTGELDAIQTQLVAFEKRPLPALSRAWPVTLILLLSPLAVVPVLQHFQIHSPSWKELSLTSGGLTLLALLLHFIGRQRSLPAIRNLAEGFGRARILLQACREKSAKTHQTTQSHLNADYDRVAEHCNRSWAELAEWLEANRGALPAQVDQRASRILARNETALAAWLQRLQIHHDALVDQLRKNSASQTLAAQRELQRTHDSPTTEPSEIDQSLATEWNRESLPILESLDQFRRHLADNPPPDAPIPGIPWSPPASFAPSVRFGSIQAQLSELLRPVESWIPSLSRFGNQWNLPLVLRFPSEGSLLIEADSSRRGEALGVLNRVVCRLLAASPPGRVSFTVFDPVGLGQSFAGLTHLADDAEHLIHGRIWTQSIQLEERLSELNDHLEKVIQMYLRNDFPTLAEYNEQAGNIAEKYRFVVIADFPSGFSDLALRRLETIAQAGARCGVFLLVHRNPKLPLPADFRLASLRDVCLRIGLASSGHASPISLNDRVVPGTSIVLDPPADTDAINQFIRQVARGNRESYRVEVPFSQIAPDAAKLWSEDSASEIRVPIGRTGATKLQYLALGKGTRQHALIAGKTGSGKSTLFHVLITNLSLWYRPDQVEFYLVDFKKGVEFKCYATHRLPHARVVAIESDRDFGLSVLQRLDEELRRRGELFRSAQVQDIAGYRKSPGALLMPRVLLLVDEFQEFFVEEDRIAQNASVLLDRIVRQGRAFGIHVILGSQTLGGAYTVARTTLGQMAVRIALQCNEADALLIMDDENPAPRLLSRPGEAIYNDAAGARLGNSPFQVVWLPDDVRDRYLRSVREAGESTEPATAGPVVFEGDAPAEFLENHLLRSVLAQSASSPPTVARTWLGAPNAIKDPTEVRFSRRSADNLLIVGQRDDANLGIFGIALTALAAQYPRDSVEFVVLDGSAPGTPDHAYLAAVLAHVSQPLTLARADTASEAILRIWNGLRAPEPAAGESHPTARFLFIHGLQNFRILRHEDEFGFGAPDAAPSPAAMLKEILVEGPTRGIHAVVSCDTYGNVMRYLGRKGLAEFASRVLFQMSANDSASLIDNPNASRLGLHRALLYSDREGHIEIFRPYAQPAPDTLGSFRG